MRFREDVEHEPCLHCGRNTCTWHLPGRRCVEAYRDEARDAKPQLQAVSAPAAPRKVA
jgi:hypothetical protein